MISLLRNVSSLTSQRSIRDSVRAIEQTSNSLATGNRLNSAADDPASLSLSMKLEARGRIVSQSLLNVGNGISVTNVMSSALDEMANVTARIRELAEQAANGTFTDKQREALNSEAQALRKEYYRVASTTEFNGVNLFSSPDQNSIRIQAGSTLDQGALYVEAPQLLEATEGSGDTTVTTTTTTTTGDGILNINSTSTQLTDFTYTDYRTINEADFNNDGIIDYLVSPENIGNTILELHLSNGSGGFDSSTIFSRTGTGAYGDYAEPLIGDVNNDGNLDVVIGNDNSKVLIGDGAGGFSQSVWSANLLTLDLGDVNNDGFLDLIGYDSFDYSTEIRLGDGSGSFGSPINSANFGFQWPSDIDSGDVNGDGILDLLIERPDTSGSQIFLGVGDGTFTAGQVMTGPDTGYDDDVELIDINGDGFLDILQGGVEFSPGDNFSYSLGNGDGTFGVLETVGLAGLVSHRGQIEIGDLNDDGNLDIAFTTTNNGGSLNGIGVMSWNGTTFEAVGHFTTAGLTAVRDISFVDTDGNGTKDIIFTTTGEGVRSFSNDTDLIKTVTTTTTSTVSTGGGGGGS